MEATTRNILLDVNCEKVPGWECLFMHRETSVFLSVFFGPPDNGRKEEKLEPIWVKLRKNVNFKELTLLLIQVFLGWHTTRMQN